MAKGAWRAADWLSLHFSLLAVYLGGEISSLKLGLGLFSFSRRWLLHASVDNRIDLLRNFDRTGGWSEREVWPIDRHGISRDRCWPWSTFSILFFKAGFVWITQISVVAGVGLEARWAFGEDMFTARARGSTFVVVASTHWSNSYSELFPEGKDCFPRSCKDLEH